VADVCDCGRIIEQPKRGRPRSKCLICKPPRKRPKPPPTSPVLPTLIPPKPAEPSGRPSLSSRTLVELAGAGRESSAAGVRALMLAEAVDAGGYNAQGMAALMKAHEQALSVAMEGAPRAADAVDELRRRRERRAAGE
jgi:hypothetical protein